MPLPYNQRTCYCGEVGLEHVGRTVVLAGWVQAHRNLGGLIFVDLRDRAGVVQLKFDPASDARLHELATQLRSEYCLVVRGEVAPRPAGLVNPRMATGAVEVLAREMEVLSPSATPVFGIADELDTSEETRMRYRYLDLRRAPMQRALIARHRIAKAIRDYFDREGFYEIETPFLTKSTPEGARDYLVPSRVNPGQFYALPQSPQLFKQLLVISGFDKYFQLVRCFRDEDLRADRQPEFTQLDMEMAFVQREDVLRVVEGCLREVLRVVPGIDVPAPFPRMTHAQALAEYGTDRPDTRYDLRIKDVSEIARRTEFGAFRAALDAGGVVRVIRVPGGARLSRKETDTLTADLQGIGAAGLPLVRIAAGEGGAAVLQTGVAKYFPPPLAGELLAHTGAGVGDILFFAAAGEVEVCKYLSWLRETVARRCDLIPAGQWNFLWVLDFPLLEYHPDDGRYYAVHHPFTAPVDEDIPLLDTDPLKVRAKAYDIVLNGVELGGGSIRIHRADVQQKIFKLLSLTPDEQRLKFGFLLDALQYGPPPHGGIALGLDRVAMLLTGRGNIRDVVAFPKTARAVCPLTGAPGPVAPEQLAELSLRLAAPLTPPDSERKT